MKKIFLSCFLAMFALAAVAQTSNVAWKFEQKKNDDGTITFSATADVAANWYMYSTQPVDGPLPTEFKFNTGKDYTLVDGIKESPKPKEKYDEAFEVNVKVFEGKVVFTQKIKPATNKPFTISGSISYQTCSGETCIMNDTEFSVAVK